LLKFLIICYVGDETIVVINPFWVAISSIWL